MLTRNNSFKCLSMLWYTRLIKPPHRTHSTSRHLKTLYLSLNKTHFVSRTFCPGCMCDLRHTSRVTNFRIGLLFHFRFSFINVYYLTVTHVDIEYDIFYIMTYFIPLKPSFFRLIFGPKRAGHKSTGKSEYSEIRPAKLTNTN